MADDAPLKTEPDTQPAPKPPIQPAQPGQTTSVVVTSTNTPAEPTPLPPAIASTPELNDMNVRAEIARINSDNKLLDSQVAISQENWFKSYWRPAMGWLYGFICLMDFVIFPAIVMLLPVYGHKYGVSIAYEQWQPLTLQFGGLFHVAMGAVLGITAWTRGTIQKSLIEK
jgi:hypothetical protein